MIKLFIIVFFQISFLVASGRVDLDENRSIGCLYFLRCLFCCKPQPKTPVKEIVLIPAPKALSITSKEIISTSLDKGDALEISMAAASAEVNKALSDLGELIKTDDYQKGDTIVDSILTQLNLIPDSAISIEVSRGPLHDVRHCATSLFDAFDIFKKGVLDDALKTSIKNNFSHMKSLLNEVFKSGSPLLVKSAYRPESVSNIAKSLVSLCYVSAIKNRTTLDSPIIATSLENYVITNKGHAFIVHRVLHNLLGNAIHYSSGVASPRVTLTLDLVEEFGRPWCRFTVSDNGPGIEDDVVRNLFKLHYRAPSTAHKSGSGVGLFSSSELVRSMGGQIGVRPQVGKGAEFWFSAPCDLGDLTAGMKVVREITKRRFKKEELRVAIADDNIVALKMLERLCIGYGLVDITVFGAGNLVLESHKEKPYDLLFLDDSMPVMTGTEVTEKIIKLGGMPPIMISIAAAQGDESSQKFIAAGMNDCLLKPPVPKVFKQLMKKYFTFTAADLVVTSLLSDSSHTPSSVI